jgi:hypothetical protein
MRLSDKSSVCKFLSVNIRRSTGVRRLDELIVNFSNVDGKPFKVG